MPDLRDFVITKLTNATMSVPRYQIACRVYSDRGQLLRDFTGANALIFPNVLANLSEAERVEMIELIANWVIDKRARA